MTDTQMAINVAVLAGLLLFPLTRKILKWILMAAVGLFLLLLIGEPRLE